MPKGLQPRRHHHLQCLSPFTCSRASTASSARLWGWCPSQGRHQLLSSSRRAAPCSANSRLLPTLWTRVRSSGLSPGHCGPERPPGAELARLRLRSGNPLKTDPTGDQAHPVCAGDRFLLESGGAGDQTMGNFCGLNLHQHLHLLL